MNNKTTFETNETVHIDIWNLLISVRDKTTNIDIKRNCDMYLRQINTAAGNCVKNEALSYLRTINELNTK